MLVLLRLALLAKKPMALAHAPKTKHHDAS